LRRIDRLVLGEIIGPWGFGVAMFTVLIMAGSFLFKLTDYAVKGIDAKTIIELTLVMLPGVMAKTFPMAVLLAALLSFGRLSGESEITAMKAAGISLYRIMRPVAMFGIGIAVLTFIFSDFLVPLAAKRGSDLETEIKFKLQGVNVRPASYPMYGKDGSMQAQMMARDFTVDKGRPVLKGVSMTAFDKKGNPTFVMLADQIDFNFENNANDWSLSGGATVISADGKSVIQIADRAWPQEIPKIDVTPDDIRASEQKDFDPFSMRQTKQRIEELKRAKAGPDAIGNWEYGYWNKIALPLAALIYALVGAPLGIRNHRSGVATGFWMAVLIIFGYMLLANFMSLQARGGLIPAYVASFTPLVVGLIVALVAIKKKN